MMMMMRMMATISRQSAPTAHVHQKLELRCRDIDIIGFESNSAWPFMCVCACEFRVDMNMLCLSVKLLQQQQWRRRRRRRRSLTP